MLIEIFIFEFAITVQFDIIDITDDWESKLKKTTLIGKNKSIVVDNISLLLSTMFFLIHYPMRKLALILSGLILLALSTMLSINNKKFRSLTYYHYCILDGIMILKVFLVIVFFYFLN